MTKHRATTPTDYPSLVRPSPPRNRQPMSPLCRGCGAPTTGAGFDLLDALCGKCLDCYRCDLNQDEVVAMEREVREEAEAAWLAYRNQRAGQAWRASGADGRRIQRRMRKRDFVAGYLRATGFEEGA